jgi:hypothetical protein
MNAAKFAVYIAKKTTANIAHTFVMKREVKPRGESTCTAAYKTSISNNLHQFNVFLNKFCYLEENSPNQPIRPE